MTSWTAPSLGQARSGLFRFAGSALPKASRTIRRCTPNLRATPRIVPSPCSYSRLICSNSSTLALQSTAASVLGSAHNRVVGPTFKVGPNQTIKRGQFKVSKSSGSRKPVLGCKSHLARIHRHGSTTEAGVSHFPHLSLSPFRYSPICLRISAVLGGWHLLAYGGNREEMGKADWDKLPGWATSRGGLISWCTGLFRRVLGQPPFDPADWHTRCFSISEFGIRAANPELPYRPGLPTLGGRQGRQVPEEAATRHSGRVTTATPSPRKVIWSASR